ASARPRRANGTAARGLRVRGTVSGERGEARIPRVLGRGSDFVRQRSGDDARPTGDWGGVRRLSGRGGARMVAGSRGDRTVGRSRLYGRRGQDREPEPLQQVPHDLAATAWRRVELPRGRRERALV